MGGYPKEWDREAGRKMYDQGETYAEIGKALGVGEGVVQGFASQYWPARKRPRNLKPWDHDLGLRLHQQGAPWTAIARAVGVSESLVRAWAGRYWPPREPPPRPPEVPTGPAPIAAGCQDVAAADVSDVRGRLTPIIQ